MECTACGTQVGDGVAFCPECGAEIAGGQSTAGAHGGQGPGNTGQHGGVDDRHGDVAEQHGGVDGRQGGRPDRQPTGTPGSQGRSDAGGGGSPAPSARASPGPATVDAPGSGRSRRQLLAAGGVAAVAATGGWFFLIRDGTDSPMDVVEESWAVWGDGTLAEYQALHYPGSPAEEEISGSTEEDFGAQEGVDWTIESREVVDRSETEVTIREEYVIHPPESEDVPSTWDIVLRRDGDTWKIYEYEYETGQ